MMFDIYAFGEICLWILPLVIFISIPISVVIGSFAKNSSYGRQVVIFLGYIFCVGVIVHEAAHQMMCGVFGVDVKEVQYFRVEYKRTEKNGHLDIGGRVNCGEINSVIAAIFLGLAPLIVNGLLVALIFYYSPILMETAYYPLFVYLGIALGMGARPSKEDLTLWYQVFKKSPERGVFELIFLFIFVGVNYAIVMVWQVELWITLTINITFLTLFIIQGRMRTSTTHVRHIPKV